MGHFREETVLASPCLRFLEDPCGECAGCADAQSRLGPTQTPALQTRRMHSTPTCAHFRGAGYAGAPRAPEGRAAARHPSAGDTPAGAGAQGAQQPPAGPPPASPAAPQRRPRSRPGQQRPGEEDPGPGAGGSAPKSGETTHMLEHVVAQAPRHRRSRRVRPLRSAPVLGAAHSDARTSAVP